MIPIFSRQRYQVSASTVYLCTSLKFVQINNAVLYYEPFHTYNLNEDCETEN